MLDGGSGAMQIDLGLVGLVLGGAGAIIAGLGRLALANFDRRLDDLVRKTDGISDRLHVEEKATIRQDGQITLVQTTHVSLEKDLQEIKDNMATKSEVSSLEKTIERRFDELQEANREVRRAPPVYAPRPTPG